MKTALSVYDNRIAPVFDIARRIHVIETGYGKIISEKEAVLKDEPAAQKMIRLKALGIGTLVCGAISKSVYETVTSCGIQVIPFIAGDLCDVIQALLRDDPDWNRFAMPGCYGMNSHPVGSMSGRKYGGMRCRGQKRFHGPNYFIKDARSVCKCTGCGHHEPHERGVPCAQKRCPVCGSAMTR